MEPNFDGFRCSVSSTIRDSVHRENMRCSFCVFFSHKIFSARSKCYIITRIIRVFIRSEFSDAKKIHKTNKAIFHLLKNFNGVNRYSWIFALISSNNPSHRATLTDWISAVRRNLMNSRTTLDSERSNSLISGEFYGPGVDFGCLWCRRSWSNFVKIHMYHPTGMGPKFWTRLIMELWTVSSHSGPGRPFSILLSSSELFVYDPAIEMLRRITWFSRCISPAGPHLAHGCFRIGEFLLETGFFCVWTGCWLMCFSLPNLWSFLRVAHRGGGMLSKLKVLWAEFPEGLDELFCQCVFPVGKHNFELFHRWTK